MSMNTKSILVTLIGGLLGTSMAAIDYSKQYIFESTPMTQTAAEAYCVNTYGSHLATIRTSEEFAEAILVSGGNQIQIGSETSTDCDCDYFSVDYNSTSQDVFNFFNASLIGRHEFNTNDSFHPSFFFVHGGVAIACWIILIFIWFYYRFGSKYHKIMGKILFCCLLITELSGMYLCFHVPSMTIPAMGMSQFISTINGFTFKTFTINRVYCILLISCFNLILLIYAFLNE
eukprot:461416_1